MKIKAVLTIGILITSYISPLVSMAETKELSNSKSSVKQERQKEIGKTKAITDDSNKMLVNQSNSQSSKSSASSSNIQNDKKLDEMQNAESTTIMNSGLTRVTRYPLTEAMPSTLISTSTLTQNFYQNKVRDKYDDAPIDTRMRIPVNSTDTFSVNEQVKLNLPTNQDTSGAYITIRFTDAISLEDFPTNNLDSMPGVTTGMKYSSNGINFAETSPTDYKDIKAMRIYLGGWTNPHRLEINFKAKINWNVANNNGPTVLAEFFNLPSDDSIDSFDEKYKRGILSSDTRALVTTNYKLQSETGKDLADPTYSYGAIGDPYSTSPKDIPGYILKETPTNDTGFFTEKEQTVNYIYLELGQPVTVNYVDEAGNKIPGVSSEILTGGIGQRYTTVQKDIPGYVFKSVSGGTVGSFSDKPYTVTYTYKVAPKVGGDVTVKYEDEQGKEIHAPQTIKGKPLGEAYDASTAQYNIDIKGYKHKEVQGNVTGTFTDQPQTVTYVYSEGLLQFVDVPQTMSFEDSKISTKTIEVKRKEVDWKIKVEDTRFDKKNWRISAKLTDSFKNTTGEETKVPILLYRQANQSDQWLDNNSEVNVFSGVSETDKDYYDVSWAEQSGPLLSIAPGAVKADQYKGEIQWNLLDTPL